MGCLLPEQGSDDQDTSHVPFVPYGVTEVAIEPQLRRVALLLHPNLESMQEGVHPVPGHLYDEKEVTKLILRLQESLLFLRLLPL